MCVEKQGRKRAVYVDYIHSTLERGEMKRRASKCGTIRMRCEELVESNDESNDDEKW